MARPKSKTFSVTHSYQFGKVDGWWANLLRQGAKEIVAVEWEAQGQMMWKLKVSWLPVDVNIKLNVGHPEYTEFTVEELDGILLDTLGNFEAAYHDLNVFENKVKEWGLSEVYGDHGPKVAFKAGLEPIEEIMAAEYLWPTFRGIQRSVSYFISQMQELETELQARKAKDYFAVTVDRGMLRQAFLEQVGYDNDWLFESQELPPVTEED